MLFAGFCSVDITPDKCYPMAGFDLRTGTNIGVHDRLFAKAVVIASGDIACAVCTLDLLGVPQDMASDIACKVSELTPIPESAVQICAIHTHAAPQAIFKGAACFDGEYRRLAVDAAVDAIVNAYRERIEVTVHCAHRTVGGVASYRDRIREDSSCEMPMDTLLLKSKKEGKNNILLTVFSCHPTVLNEANLLITRDLVWGCEKHLAERLPATDFIFINGACADLSTRYTRRSSDFSEVERLGEIWANALLESLDVSDELSEGIAFAKTRIFIPPANFFTDEQRRATIAYLDEKINACGDSEQCREYVSCRSVLKRENYGVGCGCDAVIGAVKIGKLVLGLLPFEYAQVDAVRLRSELDSTFGIASVICCYTNGYEGYLPSGRPLDRDSGYEDIASPFRHDAKEIVAKALEDLVDLLI